MSIISEALKKAEEKRRVAQEFDIAFSARESPLLEKALEQEPFLKDIPGPFEKKVERRTHVSTIAVVGGLMAGLVALTLFVTMVVFFRPMPRSIQPRRPETAYAPSRQQEAVYPAQPETAPFAATPRQEKEAAQLPPSFDPHMKSPVAAPELSLSGIMGYGKECYAVINNKMVGEGDTVADARVVKINKNNVVVMYSDTEITLTLAQ